MSRVVSVDLDDPDLAALESIWSELERRRALRDIDPELRADVERRLEDLDHVVAEVIREQLNQATPAVVLEGNWRTLIENRAALGSYLKVAQ